jgi:predicted glycoside hydrolase/deacetylase ChbG (UPF0249 family)
MANNPFMKKLGFSDDERVVITHGDDIGMCQASVQAYEDLFQFGTLTCGSVMVPCPWFPAAAELQRRIPGADLGAHLVLTSEWLLYRWRPLTAAVRGSSLLDVQGFFPRTDAEIQAKADPDEALAELEAQMQRALTFGIDLTHADTHMGAVAHPKFVAGYVQLALKYQVAPFIPRGTEEAYRAFGVDAETYAAIREMMDYLESHRVPLVDHAMGLPLDDPEDQLELARRMFGELKPGLTHFIIHPSTDTPELRAITPDWQCRVENYKVFLSDELKKHLEKENIRLIGYRRLRDAMRG